MALDELFVPTQGDMMMMLKKTALIAAMALSTGLAFAQTGNPSTTPSGMTPDGYSYVGGRMMSSKAGKTMPMESDATLSDGTKVMKDGTVMRKDGTKSMMKEGQRMDMQGGMAK